MIATINFSCTSHCDEKDVLPDDETNEMVTKVSEILNSNKTTDKNRYNEAKCTLDSLLSWGCCVPTTCCYQHVQSNTTHPVDIIQYFCIPTLGVCYQIKHYWLHCFLAGFFSHYTSVVVFVKDGLVFVGECQEADIFAWGVVLEKKKRRDLWTTLEEQTMIFSIPLVEKMRSMCPR